MPTQRDVAKAANVSIATVSHVLSGRDDRVSAETRTRVLAAIRNSGYRPTTRGSNSAEGRPVSIAFLIGDIAEKPLKSNSYIFHLLDAVLEETMRRQGAVTVFAERVWDVSGSSVRMIFDGRYDGVLSIAPTSDDLTLPLLRERGTPTVVIGSPGDQWGLSSVDIDNRYVGKEAAGYLFKRGHQKIAYLAARETTYSSIEREEGARLVCPDLITERFSGLSDAEQAATVETLCQAGVTGFFCWNDADAAVVKWLLKPRSADSSPNFDVVGVDGTLPVAGIATFSQPLGLIGKRATELLFETMRDHSRPPEQVRWIPQFVESSVSAI
jgi:DNA-binding LacI/PurR family transcriptional regulator